MSATERLEPVTARAHDAEHLGIAEGAPLMLVERTSYAADGTPVEFARDRHRGDRARFVDPRGARRRSAPVHAELAASLAALEPELGAPEGEPAALDGGITNRNFRVTLGGRDYVVRLPGKDTELLGIDRDGRAGGDRGGRRAGVGPGGRGVPDRAGVPGHRVHRRPRR